MLGTGVVNDDATDSSDPDPSHDAEYDDEEGEGGGEDEDEGGGEEDEDMCVWSVGWGGVERGRSGL